jgi:putative SOS response-associated peptidase YedK
MCNLYALTANQAAIRELAGAMADAAGNLPSQPAIYPDASAPIVRTGAEGRILARARWGLPSPAFALEGKSADRGITNVRNTASPHWRRWLGPPHRCLVPFTAFSEYGPGPDGRKQPMWFALAPDQPPAFFAGLWCQWQGTRKASEGPISTDLFAFLTCPPNAEVAAIHPKAMPVILTTPADWALWLEAPWPEAAALQRPLPDGALQLVSAPV